MDLVAIPYNKEKFINKMKSEGINDSTVEFSKDFYLCIDNSGGPGSDPYFNFDHKNVLNITFDDTNKDKKEWATEHMQYYYAVAPTEEQIKIIAKFLSNATGILHVYCNKGKSRSVAVADVVNKKPPRHTVRGSSAYGFIKKKLNFYMRTINEEIF